MSTSCHTPPLSAPHLCRRPLRQCESVPHCCRPSCSCAQALGSSSRLGQPGDTPPSKHRRIESIAPCQDENVNTINTTVARHYSTSYSSPASPSQPSDSTTISCHPFTASPPPSRLPATSSAQPSWCDCGHCIAVSDIAMRSCCWHIEPAARLPVDSQPLCERAHVADVIRDGLSNADFDSRLL